MMTVTYIIYLAASVFITVYVAHTLSKNGRVFLIDCFAGNERVADAVNHLLVVGFYLTNLAFVVLVLKSRAAPHDAAQVMQLLGGKLGFVMTTLGLMHFFNLTVFTYIRRWKKRQPVEITEFLD